MDYFKLGKVLKPQGIRGEVKLDPFVDDLGRFNDLDHLYLNEKGAYVRREVETARTYKRFAYVKLSGVADRNEAELLRGAFLYIDRQSAAPIEEGAHYIADLIGMDVACGDGRVLGRLAEVINTGGVDIYVVRGGGTSFMFPLAPGVVTDIDGESHTITVDEKRLSEVRVDD